jgi:DNA-binding NtrC family response regulator
LRDGEVIIANEVERDPRFSECASLAYGVKSVLCAPIHARGEIEGALYLDRRHGGKPFDDEAAAAARALGGMLASSLLNARTIAALTDKTRELESAREELSVALASRTVERDDISRRLAAIEDVVPGGATAIVGRSAPMLRLQRMIQMVSASDAPVLISGETGSGKELVARAIHGASGRRDRPFVAINCGGLSEGLLAAELFGAERGAYTSATSSRSGLFVAAHAGTLFLDEVGDMPPAMQTALLRVLETSEVRPVGSTKSRTVDVRILAASHRDLVDLVRAGVFRDDLRYRLEVIRIDVPALRERIEDLPELCEHLLRDARRRYNLPERRVAPAALEALSLRQWQGNVRELKHVLVAAALAAQGPIIGPDDIPVDRGARADAESSDASNVPDVDGHALRADAIQRALRATAGNRGRAAKLLGISRSTLYRYLESHGIAADSVPPPAGEERE